MAALIEIEHDQYTREGLTVLVARDESQLRVLWQLDGSHQLSGVTVSVG